MSSSEPPDFEIGLSYALPSSRPLYSTNPPRDGRRSGRVLKTRTLFQKRPPTVAILMVNGFDRRGRWGPFNEEEARSFSWADLALTQVDKLSKFGPSYEVILWDNTGLARIKT